MSRGSLSGRLSRIRRMESARADTEPAAKEQPATEQPDAAPQTEERSLDGWTPVAPFLLEKVTRYPVETRDGFSSHLPLLFPREQEELEKALPLDLSRLRFFDLETTGLSRGAGTVAFMAGVGMYESEDVLRVTQLLITDYPGEAVFLERLAALMGRDSILVSYNGKCFDSQILMNRSLMNALRPGYLSPDTPHLDLLYPARRLWKHRSESCRMQAIERDILGVHRIDDLPGSEAPDAWFEYCRSEGSERLQAVGKHNCDDVYSLMLILAAMDTEIASGEGMAALIRAKTLRKRGAYDEAADLLERAAAAGLNEAKLLLAIDCEHRLDRLERAAELSRMLGDDHRLGRIRRKIRLRAGRLTVNRLTAGRPDDGHRE